MPTPKRLPYFVFEIDLDEPRADQKFVLPRGVHWLKVLHADGTITLRLNHKDADKITFSHSKAYCSSDKGLIYEVYVTNTVQAGKKVVFAGGAKGVDIDPGG